MRKFILMLLLVIFLVIFIFGKTSLSSLPSPTIIDDGQWEVTHTTDNNYTPYIADSKDKKTTLGLIPNNGICPGETKQLYDRNDELILDNKNKSITLKCASSKCGGKNCYSISLTDAQAVNINDYVKIGLESTTYEWINSTLYIYDTDFYDRNGFEVEIYLNDSKVQTPNMKWIENNPTENKIDFYPNLSEVNYPMENISFKVNNLMILQETKKINQYSSVCSYEQLDFSTFESKNQITNKIITENKDEFGNIISYLISYFGNILDLDPTLELIYNATSNLIFNNITEGSTSGARIDTPVLFMDFNKPPENLTENNYINGTNDYIQDNSVYNNTKGDAGNLLDNGMWVDGNISNGLEFDGVNDYVSMNSALVSPASSGHSIFTWIKYYDGTAAGVGTAATSIVGNYMLHISTLTNKMYAYPNQTEYDSIGALTEGVWTHVGITCDNTTSPANVTFYINGIASGSYNTSRCNYTSSKYIGTYIGTTSLFLNSILDELYAFNRSINQTEITSLYANNIVYNSTGLVWQLNFNETSGTTAVNYANFSNNGTLTNYHYAPTYNSSCTAFSGSGGCYEFDGVNDYIDITSTSGFGQLIGNKDHTISAWIYIKDTSTRQTIVGDWNSAGISQSIFLDLNNPSGVGKYYYGVTTSTNNGIKGGTVTTGWHHILGTYDSSTHTMNLYLDGSNISQGTTSSGSVTNGVDTVIGRAGAYNGLYFNGSIDDVRIWDRVLSADEISALYSNSASQGKYAKSGDFKSGVFYNSTSVYWNTTFFMANSSGQGVNLSDPNLVSYWALDENYLDSKGTNHGTCTNCPVNATGLSSDAMRFDDVDDTIKISSDLVKNNNVTISAWIYPTSTADEAIYSNNNWFLFRVSGGRLVLRSNSTFAAYSVANSILTNIWYHIIAIRKSTGETTFYINGALSNTSDQISGNPLVGGLNWIGSNQAIGSYFGGLIDEFLIYNDTLTSAEIRNLYLTGLSQHASTNISLQTRTASTYNLTDSGLVSFWSFNTNESGNATDEKGLNNGNCSLTMCPTWNESYGLVGAGYNFNGTNNFIIENTGLQTSQSWWYKSSSGSWTYYVNSSGTFYINGAVNTSNVIFVMNGTGIGRNSTGYINGNIDEVRIYNRTLSASEVLDLYNLESSCFSDWSNWTSSSYMNDGIANKSLTFGKFFQFRAFFETNDTEVSPYLLNHSVGFGGAGDNTPPTFTTIPANASLFYGNQSLNVTFVATDETSFGYYSINDTRFSIDNPGGFLSNATPMAVGNYEINVTINDTLNNINWTTYTIQVNKSNYYDCGVYFNATSGINYPDNFIVYTNCSSDYKLYQNESEISNATTINSGAGYYNLTVQRTDIANYTNTIDSQFFSVNKNDENCQVLFNETSPLKYPGTFLVWANCTTAFVLARNGTTIENNSEQALEVGAYNFSMSRNDTSNYSIYYNESQFIINENIHPIYTENSTNNTFAGISTNFSINVTDNSALQPNGMYIFSTNNTGNWVNDSGVNFTAISQWANVTKTLNSTVGTIVGYRWFFNDSIGNTNSTPIYVVTTTIGEHLTLTKNASLNSENTTHVNYTLTIEVLNSGEVNLTSITVLDSELDLNALINLDINESYNSSNFTIIAKTISDSQKTFVKSTATVNSVTYFSNQVTINISGYGGPADAIVYAPASVSSSTSFDTIITVKNNNSDIGQDFTVDYWITNEAETTNYSSGQQTIYVAISGSSNLTAALTSPTSDGNYRFKALVTWGGGTATAYDTFVVSTPAAEEVQSRQGGGGTSRTTGEVVEEVVCNSPYIRHGKECCLDINNNSICDPDEVIKEGVNETSEINETYRGKGTSNKPILDFIKKTWNKIKKLSLLVYEFASENKVYLIEGGIALLILGILILLSIRLPSRLKHISKIKRKKPKTLKDMLGLEVYDREGNRIGKIKDIYIEKGKSKIYGWLIKIDRKKSRKKKNILIRHKYVKSISHIMIIDERVLRNIDKKQ